MQVWLVKDGETSRKGQRFLRRIKTEYKDKETISFDDIEPGTWELHISAKGFREYVQTMEMDGEIKSGQNAMPGGSPVCIAQWNDDMLTIYGSIAAPSNCQTYVAASLDIPYERVRIVAPCVGGSFGSKLFVGNVVPPVLTAIMAKASGRQ